MDIRDKSFQINLLREISLRNENSNVVLSPLSCYLALALCANGAKDDTLTEMIHCLSPNAKDLTELNENSIKVMKSQLSEYMVQREDKRKDNRNN